MRPDMSKVLVERPRKWRGPRRQLSKAEQLDGPTFEGIRRSYRSPRCLNENLQPLRRFLESRVGKYWPKVYAEICENLRPTSTVQQHVRDHLRDFVATNTSIKDDVIWVHDRWRPEPVESSGCHFYVHPISQCLMRNKRRYGWNREHEKRQQAITAEIHARRRDLGDGRQLHKLKGCWFEVRLARVPSLTRLHANSAAIPRDVVIDAGMSGLSPRELYGWYDVVAVAKRQLGRRELKAYGLANDG
jgi:hypothetical protein